VSPLTGLMTKQAPLEGHHFKGMFIPGNTKIDYSFWRTLHDAKIFGGDADVMVMVIFFVLSDGLKSLGSRCRGWREHRNLFSALVALDVLRSRLLLWSSTKFSCR
jgi:hypothetical protein